MPVTLGEVMTDADGRLVVLPGAGGAYSAPGSPPLSGFADNSGWTDDTCDGPVRATVRIGERSLEADPAWVMCVPPNYAPGVASSIVTVYDAIESALVDAGVRAAPDTVFERDVWPVFRRMSDLQWVNEGFFLRYGFGAPRDWTERGLAPAPRRHLGARTPPCAKPSSRCSAILLSSRSSPTPSRCSMATRPRFPPTRSSRANGWR